MRGSPMLAAAILALVAGCAGNEGDAAAPEAPPRGAQVVALRDGDTMAADFACATGGATLRREMGVLVNNTDELHVEIAMAPTFSGVQFGYAVDGEEPAWLPTFLPPGGELDIPVAPEEWESPTRKNVWEFRYRHNVGGADPDCNTGAGTGALRILVTLPGG